MPKNALCKKEEFEITTVLKKETQQILFQQLIMLAEKNKTCEPIYIKDNIQAMLNIYTTLFSDQSYLEYHLRP